MVERALASAMSTASELAMTVDDAVVVNNSNRLAVRLLPCDVLARVQLEVRQAQFEVEVARNLEEADGPVAGLDPRIEPLVYERDGFAVTLWTYYGPTAPGEISPADYADALVQLHKAMRTLDVTTPHFTDRVESALRLVSSQDHTPGLVHADRELLRYTLQSRARARARARALGDRNAVEQLLHGEPHPGNLLRTDKGVLFVDLETCCRGSVEFDLAHVPEEVGAHYPDVDQEMLSDCRVLVLAMVAAWRWDVNDQFPNGRRAALDLLDAIRGGPPWPALDSVMPETL